MPYSRRSTIVDEKFVRRLVKDLAVGDSMRVSDWDIIATDVPGERSLFVDYTALENELGPVKITRTKQGFKAVTIEGIQFDPKVRFNPQSPIGGILHRSSGIDDEVEFYYIITSIRIVNEETLG
jgi:hypothetical protein